MADFIMKLSLTIIIILQLFWIGSTLDKIYDERTIRVTEIKHYAVDIVSNGSLTVPTELDYPGNPNLFTKEGR